MFKHLSIKFRLIFVIAFLSIGLLGIGMLGLAGMSKTNDGLRDVYQNRAIPLGQLKQIELLLQQNRFTLTVYLVAPRPEVLSNNTARIENNIAEVSQILDAYRATDLVPEEREVADKFSDDYNHFVTQGLRPVVDAWNTGEFRVANGIIANAINNLYRPVLAGIDKLSQMQMVIAKQKYEQAQQRYERIRNFFIIAIGLGLLSAIWIGFVLIRAIVRPLNRAVAIAHAVAAGNLTSKIHYAAHDEAGRLMQALKDMNDNLIKLVGNVRSSADSIAIASKEIAVGDNDLSQRTEEQASSLQETASSMEELTATVKQNAENANQANELGLGARDVAIKGGEVVSKVVTTMASINESSKKIEDIISVIEGIAFQTNILALNAAVEAARAGEQGRGFAVVANEVRTLAQRTSAAAKEIKELIGDSVKRVAVGTRLVDEAGRTMEEIVTAVKSVTEIMADISAASSEQSAGIDQVNKAITRMDEVTQQNASLVEQVAAAAESMEEEAERLIDAVSVFQLAEENQGNISHPHFTSAVAKLAATHKTQQAGAGLSNKYKSLPKNSGDWREF